MAFYNNIGVLMIMTYPIIIKSFHKHFTNILYAIDEEELI